MSKPLERELNRLFPVDPGSSGVFARSSPSRIPPRLSRSALPKDQPAAPVRIVHLGLGAFHRAHQAWYTAHAQDAANWGISAYTGRHGSVADRLSEQDGVYSLLVRGPESDAVELIGSVVRASSSENVDEFASDLARPEVSVLTLTITEGGYRLNSAGAPDLSDSDVRADVEALRDWVATPNATTPALRTALGRVLVGLQLRRRAGAPPLAIVPCDNLPDNATVVHGALFGLAQLASADLSRWLEGAVTFVATSVDRITPRVDSAELATLQTASGFLDQVPVVTEPFSDWVLSGSFPSGRPAWETAGARFVDDIRPWEARKLWLLNGAHTLLAASGSLRGHTTVAEAIADPVCRAQVEALWDEAAEQLPQLQLEDYRAALLARFSNPRLEHRLAQIAEDSRTKIRLRIVPVALAERISERPAFGCAGAIAAWLIVTYGSGLHLNQIQKALEDLSPQLAADAFFTDRVTEMVSSLTLTHDRNESRAHV